MDQDGISFCRRFGESEGEGNSRTPSCKEGAGGVKLGKMSENNIKPLQAPDPNYNRYTQKPFPAYRFIPGINPHPQRDPKGHSYGKVSEEVKYQPAEEWKKNQNYLYGVDLYNYAYWWESHEAWEDLWHTTNKDLHEGQFLQGLIQISAAFIKWHLHQDIGMNRLYQIGIGRLEFVCQKFPNYMGLDLKTHIQMLKKHFAQVIPSSKVWSDPLINYPFIHLK